MLLRRSVLFDNLVFLNQKLTEKKEIFSCFYACVRFVCLLVSLSLEDRNVIIDLGTMFLCNTFRYPDDVTAFLLFQFQIRVENAEMELLDECKHIQFHLESETSSISHTQSAFTHQSHLLHARRICLPKSCRRDCYRIHRIELHIQHNIRPHS